MLYIHQKSDPRLYFPIFHRKRDNCHSLIDKLFPNTLLKIFYVTYVAYELIYQHIFSFATND